MTEKRTCALCAAVAKLHGEPTAPEETGIAETQFASREERIAFSLAVIVTIEGATRFCERHKDAVRASLESLLKEREARRVT